MHFNVKDITGEKFGRLIVIGVASEKPMKWKCECECGNFINAFTTNLIKGNTKSCGCLRRERHQEIVVKHGHASRGKSSGTYCTWSGMIARCKSKDPHKFKYYGSKGITVCDSWKYFENFLKDMGERPEGHSIDRIDPTGDYEPSNCRWADTKTQARNKVNCMVTIDGITKPHIEWCEQYGVSYKTASERRIKHGFCMKCSISLPKYGRCSHK